MITTCAPIDAVGILTASVTVPPVRAAVAVAFVIATGLAALPPPPSSGATITTGAAGVTAADGADADPVPAAFVAVTVNR